MTSFNSEKINDWENSRIIGQNKGLTHNALNFFIVINLSLLLAYFLVRLNHKLIIK